VRKFPRRKSTWFGSGKRREIGEQNLSQDVTTDGVRKASRARAPDSPVPGEDRTSERPGQTKKIMRCVTG
jgi:hypothetical protein